MEDSVVTFYLSKSFPLDVSLLPEEIFNVQANLTIVGSNGYQSQPADYWGRGQYRIAVGKLDDDVAYGIQIEYDGNTYQSTLSKPLHTPEIQSVSFTQPVARGTVFFNISTYGQPGEAQYYLWSCTEDWEIMANISTNLFFNPMTSSFYSTDHYPYLYCWNSFSSRNYTVGTTEALSENRIINKQFFQTEPVDNRFGVLYCLTVHQKAISKSAHEYYQNKIKINEEMGGLFTPQPSELNGNITCITDPSKRVMGYVEAVKNVVQKRLFISSGQIITYSDGLDCEPLSPDVLAEMSYAALYGAGYRPYIEYNGSVGVIRWTYARCTSCMAKGGTKNKPDFWPNDHQ